ncbi:MAG: EI24 domain-containing protein [Bdellovibrionales bacterium]|nr:EI24 domain-containing protein [Bdellovibrionales bacterium]
MATRVSRIESLIFGLSMPLHALKLILKKPKLIIWSMIPLAITLFVYFKFIAGAQDAVTAGMNAKMTEWGFGPDSSLGVAAAWVGKILILVLSVLTFTFVSTLIASPFNDFLAESTEAFANPPLPPIPGFSFQAKLRLVILDLAKTVAATIATLLALVISWVPFLNLVSFTLAALLVCFQYTSYPQTRRGITLASGLGFLWRHFYVCLGFGIILSGLFAIPLLSSFALPLAVVGGTLLVARAPGNENLPALR